MESVISLMSLTFNYPDGQKALENITLTVNQGETVALIGPNGAGKSTLLLHLNGILRSNGAVTILGKLVNEHNLKWVRTKSVLFFKTRMINSFHPLFLMM